MTRVPLHPAYRLLSASVAFSFHGSNGALRCSREGYAAFFMPSRSTTFGNSSSEKRLGYKASIGKFGGGSMQKRSGLTIGKAF
jgi:hypothetical protein